MIARQHEDRAVRPALFLERVDDDLRPISRWERLVEQVACAEHGVDSVALSQPEDRIEHLAARPRKLRGVVRRKNAAEALAEMPVRGVEESEHDVVILRVGHSITTQTSISRSTTGCA